MRCESLYYGFDCFLRCEKELNHTGLHEGHYGKAYVEKYGYSGGVAWGDSLDKNHTSDGEYYREGKPDNE